MLTVTFHPLTHWPRTPTPAKARKESPFRAPYAGTLELLEHELGMLGATDIRLFADVSTGQIRQDGWIRAGVTPNEPGVVLTFDLKGQGVTMPCDTYRDWQDNIRAIALSLQALRAVDRYGVTRAAEQYRGFRALPAPADPRHMTREEAAEYLANVTGAMFPASHLLSNPESLKATFRVAVRMFHPDRGGDRTVYQMVLDAREVLMNVHADTRL